MIRSVHHDQWGNGKGGPILAAKISPGSQIRSVHHNQWGDCFWLGGTNFGCQNQSGETDFGCQNWSGGPFFRKNGSGGSLAWPDRFLRAPQRASRSDKKTVWPRETSPGGPLLGGTDFGVTGP